MKWPTVVVVGEKELIGRGKRRMTENLKRLFLFEKKKFSKALDSSMLMIPKMSPVS